jgi:hypothetical protein
VPLKALAVPTNSAADTAARRHLVENMGVGSKLTAGSELAEDEDLGTLIRAAEPDEKMGEHIAMGKRATLWPTPGRSSPSILVGNGCVVTSTLVWN